MRRRATRRTTPSCRWMRHPALWSGPWRIGWCRCCAIWSPTRSHSARRAARIALRAREAGGMVEIIVEDDGPGIPDGNLEQIFDRFYSERPKGEKFGQHSGLGLSISRQIVEALRGRIAAENRRGTGNKVLGARFVVTTAKGLAKVKGPTRVMAGYFPTSCPDASPVMTDASPRHGRMLPKSWPNTSPRHGRMLPQSHGRMLSPRHDGCFPTSWPDASQVMAECFPTSWPDASHVVAGCFPTSWPDASPVMAHASPRYGRILPTSWPECFPSHGRMLPHVMAGCFPRHGLMLPHVMAGCLTHCCPARFVLVRVSRH